MASLQEYQRQFKTALENAPDFLIVDGFYVYNKEGSTYNPEKDEYKGTSIASVTIKCIRGQELVDGVNHITYLTESRTFTFGKPSVNGQLAFANESWNIVSISQDPIGLTYLFTVENKDGI